MNWYRVTRADGTYSYVQETSKSKASQKVRYAGELIKAVKQIDESDVPASAKGGATPPTTPTPPTSRTGIVAPGVVTGRNIPMDIDYSRASIAEELPPPTGEERYGATEGPPPTTGAEYTQQQRDDYDDYLAFLQTPDGKKFPTPKDIADYLTNREQWIADYDYYLRGYTEEQLREFNTWKRYASTYGDLTDWFPNNIDDWLTHYDTAQEQLAKWQQEHGTALEEEEVSEAEQAEEDKYRQEQREKAAYYEQERYTAAPEYQPRLQQWLDEKLEESRAFELFSEKQYPSLVSKFKLTQPELTGYSTREEARTEKARREQKFAAWLPGQVPGLKQEYWGQRPTERGERLYMQSPNVRELSW